MGEIQGAEILVGDAREVLRTLPEESVHCVVTSPPYWGLRCYGVAGQLGLEESPAEYVEKMVTVFREVWRVMRPDGTLWLNMGDGYATTGSAGRAQRGLHELVERCSPRKTPRKSNRAHQGVVPHPPRRRKPPGFKLKDLIGMPWRLAFALQEDGWLLRTDIIWHKSNPMPESVRDRPTRCHEYIFLLSKSPRYFYDYRAVTEPVSGGSHPRGKGVNPKAALNPTPGRVKQNASFSAAVAGLVSVRNRRTVWKVNTQCFHGAHFAVFPEKLVEPCILAGSPRGGLVLDPFAGSGTTGVVALRHGRDFIGIDLNPAYAEMARARLVGVQTEVPP